MSAPAQMRAPDDSYELRLTKNDVGKKFLCWDGTTTKIVKYDDNDRDGTPFLNSQGFWHDPQGRTMKSITIGNRPQNIVERFSKHGRPD